MAFGKAVSVNNNFNLRTWIDKAEKSNNFDSYKLYVIKCFNDDELFFKVGKSFTTVENRFKGNFPYKYEIIDIVESNPFHISKLEKKIHRELKEFKYTPKISFVGQTECFNNIDKYHERKEK